MFLISLVLHLCWAVVGGFFGGIEFSLGILVTTGVMMLNLWGWSKVVGSAIGAAVQGNKPVLALGFYGAKCGLMGGSLWFLLGIFPVLSVILGSSVVFTAVGVWGLRTMFGDQPIGDVR